MCVCVCVVNVVVVLVVLVLVLVAAAAAAVAVECLCCCCRCCGLVWDTFRLQKSDPIVFVCLFVLFCFVFRNRTRGSTLNT